MIKPPTQPKLRVANEGKFNLIEKIIFCLVILSYPASIVFLIYYKYANG